MASSLRISAALSIAESEDRLCPAEVSAYLPHDGRCLNEKNRNLNHERCVLDYIKKKSQLACIIATFYGYASLLRTAFNSGCRICDLTVKAAIANCDLPCLEFAWENQFKTSFSKTTFVYRAIDADFIDGVRFLIDKVNIDDDMVRYTVRHGKIEIIKLFIERGYMVVSSKHVFIAVNEGQLECMRFLMAKIDAWTNDDVYDAAKTNNAELLRVVLDYPIADRRVFPLSYVYSVTSEIATMLLEAGHLSSTFATTIAIGTGATDYLERLLDEQTDLDIGKLIYYAIVVNNLECLRIIVDRGYKLSSFMLNTALQDGNATCARYLLEKKCPHNNDSTRLAVGSGNLECVSLLLEYDAISEANIPSYASANVKKCLVFLMEKGFYVRSDFMTLSCLE